MASQDIRYDPIDQPWSSVAVPPISWIEAERAARAFYRHFGGVHFGGPQMKEPARFSGKARRCWITRRAGDDSSRGWPRLVHDVSHRIFARRHPSFRPHAGDHATLEREIAAYVIEQGWLAGTLRARPRRKISSEERRAARQRRRSMAIERWERKLRRAQKALKKLKRRERDALRRHSHPAGATESVAHSPRSR